MILLFVVQNEFLEWRRTNSKKVRPFLSNSRSDLMLFSFPIYWKSPYARECVCTWFFSCYFLYDHLLTERERRVEIERKRWKKWQQHRRRRRRRQRWCLSGKLNSHLNETHTNKHAERRENTKNFFLLRKLTKNVDAIEWKITKRIQGHAYIRHCELCGCVMVMLLIGTMVS